MKEKNKKGGESLPLAAAKAVVSPGSTAASSFATPSAGHIPATPLSSSFANFYETVKQVREGCPWDKDQTQLSLRSTFFEETCEAIDAIVAGDSDHVKEELGDVLLNVVLIARLFEEKGLFTVEETIQSINEKLIRRHPHVFAESEGKSEVRGKIENPEGVTSQWDRIKENVEGRKSESVLDEVPENFPPILKAYKMLKKAAKKGFEWKSLSEVQMKFCEELAEFRDSLIDVEQAKKTPEEKPFTESSSNEALNKAQLHAEEEFGDVLLALINYGRWVGIDPSVAMERASRKFYKRFSFVEKQMKENGIEMNGESIKQMMEFWCAAKEL